MNEPKGPHRGVPLPGGASPRTYNIVWPKLSAPVDWTSWSEGWTGYPTHWVLGEGGKGGRTLLCTAECGECPHCGLSRLGWTGYLSGYHHDQQEPAILLLTVEAAKSFQAVVGQYASLRGVRVYLRRGTSRANGPVVVERHALQPRGSVPQAFDFEPTLQVLWGLARAPSLLCLPGDPNPEGRDGNQV